MYHFEGQKLPLNTSACLSTTFVLRLKALDLVFHQEDICESIPATNVISFKS
jgi:hypothetical protein